MPKPSFNLYAVDANDKSIRYQIATAWPVEFDGEVKPGMYNIQPVKVTDKESQYKSLSLVDLAKAMHAAEKEGKRAFYLSMFSADGKKGGAAKGKSKAAASEDDF